MDDATIVAPGNYDGVHLGHRALLEAARGLASAGERVTVLTFDPHPARLLAPERAPRLLTTIERRRALLLGGGADAVEVLRFDEALAALPPGRFVVEVLVERLRARGVVVGADFRYGRDRRGDVESLRAEGEARGFVVSVVEPLTVGGEVVSSTRVRRMLREGDVRGAARLLDRPHDVEGEVREGARRGRTLGFPTANLECEPVALPADGVYAVVARVAGGEGLLRGVANLGVRPTFEAGRSVEVHLLDFEGDLYGRRLRVGFVARIRGERRFDGVEALRAQIAADVARARRELEDAEGASWRWI